MPPMVGNEMAHLLKYHLKLECNLLLWSFKPELEENFCSQQSQEKGFSPEIKAFLIFQSPS